MRAVGWVTDCQQYLRGELLQGPAEVIWPASGPWINQFGPALVWAYAPFVVGAKSLQAAFAGRYLIQAMGVLLVYASLRWVLWPRGTVGASQGVWPARLGAWIAALAVGFTGEPFGTLGAGDQNYLAPDLGVIISVAAALVLLHKRPHGLLVGFAVVPLAAMFHPLALCYLPGLLLLAVHVWLGGRRRIVAASLAVGLLCSIPELVHIAVILMQGPGGEALGFYSFHSYSSVWILNTATEAFATLQPFPAGPILLASPFVVLVWCAVGGGADGLRGKERGAALFALWGVLTVGGLLALVLLLGNHRGYHWRIALPGLALVLGLAVYLPAQVCRIRLARARTVTRWAVPAMTAVALAVLSACVVVARIDRFPQGTGDLRMHRWMAELIQEDAGTSRRWYDTVLLGWEMQTISPVFMPSVYVEQRLMNVPREAFHADGVLYLAVTGPPSLVEDLRTDMGWDDRAMQRWGPPPSSGGASGVAIRGTFPTDVHLLGHHSVGEGYSMLLVRLADPVATRAWTAWLHQRFTGIETPRLMMDSNFVLSLTMPDQPYANWCCWFDPGLLQEYPGVFSGLRNQLVAEGRCGPAPRFELQVR